MDDKKLWSETVELRSVTFDFQDLLDPVEHQSVINLGNAESVEINYLVKMVQGDVHLDNVLYFPEFKVKLFLFPVF